RALRAVYPGAEIIATRAVEGALVGFFPKGRAQGDALIASGQGTPEPIEEIKLRRRAVADTRNLLPTRPITQSGAVDIAGRRLDLHVAPFAATEADLWIYDDAPHPVVARDLVGGEGAFFRTRGPWGR